MSSTIVEVIDGVTLSADQVQSLIIVTVEGSRIEIREGRLKLVNFLRYTHEQKVTWDLENSVLGQRKDMLCLVIPHQASSGAAWIPLARMPNQSTDQLTVLKACVLYARKLLNRSLPDGEHDVR